MLDFDLLLHYNSTSRSFIRLKCLLFDLKAQYALCSFIVYLFISSPSESSDDEADIASRVLTSLCDITPPFYFLSYN